MEDIEIHVKKIVVCVLFSLWIPIVLSSQKSFVKEIPISKQLDLVFTEVKIKNKTFKLLIDTGSPCVLFTNAAEQINFRPKKRVRISDSNGRRKKVRVGNLPKLKIGDLEYKSTKFIVMDFEGPILNCLDFDGIIGANLMSQHTWQFETSARKIRIASSVENLKIDSSIYRTPMRLNGWQRSPYIDVKVNEQVIQTLYDTGFSGFYTLAAKAYTMVIRDDPSALRSLALLKGVGNEGALGSEESTTRIINMDIVKVATRKYTDVSAQLDQGGISKLGSKYFKDRTITFDFPNKQLYIQETSEAYDSFSLNSFGFSLALIDEAVTVGALIKDSPAEKMGLTNGDEVISIDSILIDAASICTSFFTTRSYLESKDSIELTIKRGEQVKAMSLDKQIF